MDDIVERLRQRDSEYVDGCPVTAPDYIALEAADEIERLRAELADAIKAIDRLHYERRRWIEAFGLVSTVCPSMEIDTSQPMKMAKTMVQYVDDLRNKGQELDDKCEALRKMDDIVEQLRALEKREAGNCYSVNKAMLDAAAEIDRLRAECEALRKDAERYRWLRDIGDRTWTALANRRGLNAAAIDSAIDRAMASIAEGGSNDR